MSRLPFCAHGKTLLIEKSRDVNPNGESHLLT